MSDLYQTEVFRRRGPNFTVMGLDLSTTATGIVVVGPGEISDILEARTVGYSLKRKDPEKARIDRLANIVLVIDTLVKQHEPRYVGIEGYSYGSKYAREVLAELHGVVKVQLYMKHGIVPCIYPPSTVRKAVFGYGGTDKDRIVKIVRALEEDGAIKGKTLDDHNQCDAWAVAQHIRRLHGEGY